jgi:DNA-binding NarL/FixJ family response regulator
VLVLQRQVARRAELLARCPPLRAGQAEPAADEKLTEREVEVLRLLAGGYSNREIGTALGVAERTVKNNVSSILAKLWVRDRTRAVLKGDLNGPHLSLGRGEKSGAGSGSYTLPVPRPVYRLTQD